MATTRSDRTGVLVIRLWIEENHPTSLRARITEAHDNIRGEHTVAVASSGEGISAIVERWVETFTDLGSPDGDGQVTLTEDDHPS